ncbi:dUTP diphosphatase [Anaerotruncus rubiinfantis]|uniref:dUTP diphosphatase n=1 Tax=Anaerotruncus rubiinfantis TaxID=1720200 RepID=UPI003C2E2B56
MMLKMKRLRPSAQIPKNATPGSAGYDLYADLDAPVEIPAGRTAKIPTGLAMAVEPGYAGFVFARSGLGIKHGIVPANCVGVIDSDYRGEVIVGLHNQSQEAFTVNPGDRVAQLVLLPVFTPGIEVCEELDETGRGAGGFGSTGR